jgi:hypothetical protein
MNKEITEWFEELPDQCPPEDAIECNGVYFRIANGNPATSEDFFSQRKLQPDKIFKGEGIDDCIVKSISLFSDKKEIEKRMKLPKFKKAVIAEVKLEPKDGKIKKTFGFAHYSWWRTNHFNVSQAKVL